MIEIVIGFTLAVILWTLRHSFYSQADVFKEKVELQAKEQHVDLQDDYAELHKAITDKKQANGGHWYSMSDLDNLMKNDNKGKVNE